MRNPSSSASTAPPSRAVARRLFARFSPMQAVALSFLGLIAVGTGLLSLPIAQKTPAGVPLLDCLFTATSATCVTGLVTVSTADSWTTFGQLVILGLIQIGGLGYMTLATILAAMLGLRVGLRARLQLQESHGALTLQQAVGLARYAVLATIVLESIGALALGLRFYFRHGMPAGRAVFEGIFYSISAFCNAGFDLAPGFQGLSLPSYRVDLTLLLAMSALIILGGLGFGVLAEIATLPRVRRLTLHAKLVLLFTGVLLVTGALFFLLFESGNPAELSDTPARLVTAWFMSATPRTAGFCPVDLTEVAPPTLFLLSLLMVVGGAPGSTAGGIKITTFAMIFLAVLSLVRRRRDIEAFGRRVSGDMSRLALSLTAVYVLGIMFFSLLIGITEVSLAGLGPSQETVLHYNRLLFELVSAFGTVGLSAGITPTLTAASRALIIVAMYLGRLGPLAFVFAFAQPKRTVLRRLPEEGVMGG